MARSPAGKKKRAERTKTNDRSVVQDDEAAEDRRTTVSQRVTKKSGGCSHKSSVGLGAAECKKLVHNFVENTLKKGVPGLRAEFASHKRVLDMTKMTVFAKNAAKNRYKDVGCIDETRVVLKDADNDYIHANYVSTPNSDKRFICCQAPLDSTCVDHWKMIIQEKVDIILMLCNLTEKGSKKCAEYYPNEKGATKTFDKYTIKCHKSTKMKFPTSTTAVVMISALSVEVDGKKTADIDHYQWVDWPDRGVPPADLAPIQLLAKIAGTQSPIVVHCSAGIGRTGSIVLIQYTLESIASGQTAENMDVLLLKLRKQRANSVQTDQQYLYVHMVLLNYFQKEGYLDKSVLPFIDGFTAQYKKAVG